MHSKLVGAKKQLTFLADTVLLAELLQYLVSAC